MNGTKSAFFDLITRLPVLHIPFSQYNKVKVTEAVKPCKLKFTTVHLHVHGTGVQAPVSAY